jgi:hypothetical protein
MRCHLQFTIVLMAIATLAVSAAPCLADPITELVFVRTHAFLPPSMQSWGSNDSQVTAFAGSNKNPPADTTRIIFSRALSDYGNIIFTTERVPGQPLVPGTYLDVHRIIATMPGQPGIDLDYSNNGFNSIEGHFTVLEALCDVTMPQPTVISFAATFDVQADAFRVVGHVYYNFSPSGSVVPEPGSLILLGLGAIALGAYVWRRRLISASAPASR